MRIMDNIDIMDIVDIIDVIDASDVMAIDASCGHGRYMAVDAMAMDATQTLHGGSLFSSLIHVHHVGFPIGLHVLVPVIACGSYCCLPPVLWTAICNSAQGAIGSEQNDEALPHAMLAVPLVLDFL